jgi:hypothetical protein
MKEEGRRKREEGRRKREEGRRKREEGKVRGKVRRCEIVYFLRDSRWRRTLRLMTNF